MKVYASKNSQWYFEENLDGKKELVKKGDDLTTIVDPVYVHIDNIKNLIKKYEIKRDKIIPKKAVDKFMDDLKKQTMSLEQVGGMFITLVDGGDKYRLERTGTIREILEKDTGEYLVSDLGLELDSDDSGPLGENEINLEKITQSKHEQESSTGRATYNSQEAYDKAIAEEFKKKLKEEQGQERGFSLLHTSTWRRKRTPRIK